MTTARDLILILAALCIVGVCLCVLRLADDAAADWNRATGAVVQTARHLNASADRLTADAEAACEHLTALPEQAAAIATAPALSALHSLPFGKPRPTPTPSRP